MKVFFDLYNVCSGLKEKISYSNDKIVFGVILCVLVHDGKPAGKYKLKVVN